MAWPHVFGNQTQANGSWLDDNFNQAVSYGPNITLQDVSFTVGGGNSVGLNPSNTSGSLASFIVGSAAINLMGFGVSSQTVGSISTNGTSTSYNTTSDAALKSVHGPSDGSPLSALPIRDCTFTSEGSGATPCPMILAQECEVIAPWAVTQGSADGKMPCMIDYSKLVAPLIAYAQALEARIAALEAKAALAAPIASAGLVAARSALASAAALPVVQAAIARGVALKGASNGSPQAQTL